MASIDYDKTTNGKYRVRAIDGRGEDIELFFDTHIEAQTIANIETQNQIKYFNEFQVIDGRKHHPTGLNFREWLKSKYVAKEEKED